MIQNLEISNYRLFSSFHIDSLAQVNLIVGNNNSGKSSLLEAVHLLTTDDLRSSLLYILSERGEIATGAIDSRYGRSRSVIYQIAHLFHNRSVKSGQRFHIFTQGNSKYISLNIVLQGAVYPENEDLYQPSLFEERDEIIDDMFEEPSYLLFERRENGVELPKERLRLTGDGILIDNRLYGVRKAVYSRGGSRLLTTNYIGFDELATLWDKITLTPKEDKVVEAMQILEPRVERISFTSSQASNSGILLRLKGESDPIPLGSMGDGMRRILAIIASLVSVDSGTLLVDEIDTGLYHSALVNMWRLVLETSVRQGAQVWATTHSWDCVQAFQQALEDYGKPEVGKLIRLEKFDDQIQAVHYSASELEIAVEQQIEVR